MKVSYYLEQTSKDDTGNVGTRILQEWACLLLNCLATIMSKWARFRDTEDAESMSVVVS